MTKTAKQQLEDLQNDYLEILDQQGDDDYSLSLTLTKLVEKRIAELEAIIKEEK